MKDTDVGADGIYVDAGAVRSTSALVVSSSAAAWPWPVSGDALADVPHYMGRLSAVARGVHLVPDPPMPVDEALAMNRLSNMIDGQPITLAPWIRQWLQDQLERTSR